MAEDTTSPVVGIGEILWDLLPGGKQLGGAVMNVVYHVHQLGEPAQIVSSVGEDALGVEVRATLHRLGLGATYIATVPGRPTGTVDVQMGANGMPRYTIREHVAWDGVPLTPALIHLAQTARALCFGTLAQRAPRSRATVLALLDAAPPSTLRVFDINLRHNFYDRDVITDSLHRANVLKLNHEELPIIIRLLDLPPTEGDALAALLSGYDLRLVALTRGGDGSVLITKTERDERAGTTIAVRDTIGAGDSFTAALIVGFLRGLPLAQIHEAAARLSAYVCTQPGGTPPLTPELCALFAAAPGDGA